MDNMDSILTKLLISTDEKKKITRRERDKEEEKERKAKIMESIRQFYRPTKIK